MQKKQPFYFSAIFVALMLCLYGGGRHILDCTKLHTVILPSCDKLIIEKSAFEGCSALRTVILLCNSANIQENAFVCCENAVFISNCEDVLSFARNNDFNFIDIR